MSNSIELLENLEVLNVSYNRFTTIPEGLGKLKKLRELNLEGNDKL